MGTYARYGPFASVRSLNGNKLKNKLFRLWVLDLLALVVGLPACHNRVSCVIRTPFTKTTAAFNARTSDWIDWMTVDYVINAQIASPVGIGELIPVEDLPWIDGISPGRVS